MQAATNTINNEEDDDEDATTDLAIADQLHRIQWKGQIDGKGCGKGRLTRFSLRNGLEEVSIEGRFHDGLLEGLVRLVA